MLHNAKCTNVFEEKVIQVLAVYINTMFSFEIIKDTRKGVGMHD